MIKSFCFVATPGEAELIRTKTADHALRDRSWWTELRVPYVCQGSTLI